MSRTKAKQPSKPTPAKKAAPDKPGKPPVAADKVTSTPMKPITDPRFNGSFEPTFMHLATPALVTEPKVAPPSQKPVNTGRGTPSPAKRVKGKPNA
jgi:hypothetical protein